MFRPPLGILPSFFPYFQLPDVLHTPHRRSVGLEPVGDRVKKIASGRVNVKFAKFDFENKNITQVHI